MIIQTKKPKSPLRYPGGKSRGVNEITKFIPDNTKEIHSPFFGGGSIEIACANNGITVYGYDNFKPLVEFWQCLLDDRMRLAEIIKGYYPLSKTRFYELQKTYSKSKYGRAAIYYVLNRTSFSGIAVQGGMSPDHPRFTISSIERIENFQIENLQIEYADFKESILKSRDQLLYCDPPYMIKSKLYGSKRYVGFDHIGLAKMLSKRKNWILSYNDCKEIHDLYNDFKFYYPQWTYGMSSNKKSKEVLIFSDDLSNTL